MVPAVVAVGGPVVVVAGGIVWVSIGGDLTQDWIITGPELYWPPDRDDLIETIEVPCEKMPEPDFRNTAEQCRRDYQLERAACDIVNPPGPSRTYCRAKARAKLYVCTVGVLLSSPLGDN